MPALVYELMQLYPQTGQRRPSVEFIPQPYGPPERRRRRTTGEQRGRPMTDPGSGRPETDETATDDQDELLDLLRRERADFRNYQRRVADERAADADRVRGRSAEPIFPLLDDLGRAFAEVPARTSRTTRGPGASRCCGPGSSDARRARARAGRDAWVSRSTRPATRRSYHEPDPRPPARSSPS